MTPYGSPGPRGRTTDHRAEGRTRGRARAKGPKPRGMGRPRNDHRAEARTTRSAPGSRRAEEPPLAARSAQKGRGPAEGHRPGGGTMKALWRHERYGSWCQGLTLGPGS